jgi:hypothetical protein
MSFGVVAVYASATWLEEAWPLIQVKVLIQTIKPKNDIFCSIAMRRHSRANPNGTHPAHSLKQKLAIIVILPL